MSVRWRRSWRQYGVCSQVSAVSIHRYVLGENIRTVRRAEGLTEERLAELAGLPVTTIKKVERGLVGVSFDALVRIAKALKISVHDLTAGT